jgi:hypothetical protein
MREKKTKGGWMMSILDQLASSQGRRDQIPNQELAKDLVRTRNQEGIQEMIDHLMDEGTAVQSDCVKVLYEVGYLDPSLIADYWPDFLNLLDHKNNRLKWGGMIALATIAGLRADELFPQRGLIAKALDEGSVIVRDNAVKVLAAIASTKEEYQAEILPSLFAHLARCRVKDVPQHAESTLIAISDEAYDQFIALLESRMEEMSDSQARRSRKLINGLIDRSRKIEDGPC